MRNVMDFLSHRAGKMSTTTTKLRTVKVLVLGSSGVGKTSLIYKLCDQEFIDVHKRTVYDEFEIQKRVQDDFVDFKFMDMAAPNEYPAMLNVFIQKADIYILMYSADCKQSFSDMLDLRGKILEVKNAYTTSLPFVVVCNKVDSLPRKMSYKKRCQHRKAISHWCYELHEVSVKTGENVNAVLENVISASKLVIDSFEAMQEPSFISGTYYYEDHICRCPKEHKHDFHHSVTRRSSEPSCVSGFSSFGRRSFRKISNQRMSLPARRRFPSVRSSVDHNSPLRILRKLSMPTTSLIPQANSLRDDFVVTNLFGSLKVSCEHVFHNEEEDSDRLRGRKTSNRKASQQVAKQSTSDQGNPSKIIHIRKVSCQDRPSVTNEETSI